MPYEIGDSLLIKGVDTISPNEHRFVDEVVEIAWILGPVLGLRGSDGKLRKVKILSSDEIVKPGCGCTQVIVDWHYTNSSTMCLVCCRGIQIAQPSR